MKKIVLVLLVFVFFVSFAFTAPLLTGEKEVLDKIEQLYQKKDYEKALLDKIEQLYQKKDYEKALEVIDKGLNGFSEPEKLLAAKFNILLELDRPGEALKVAIKRADAAERKSPWHCIDIVSICLELKDTEMAFAWLNKAVDRGFLSYSELYNDEFKPLHKDKRFNQLVEKIKSQIGIDKPAKDFTIELISGEKFTLAEQKGKVILVDFWATWCKPCVKGIQHLKEFYPLYKDKGFEIIGISLDSNKKDVEDYINKENIKWKIAFSGAAWKDATARYYHVNLIPSYWLIDRNGILRDFGIHLRDEVNMKKAIEKLTRGRGDR